MNFDSQSIKHIFFDLDHTLWDFEKNAQETITELFDELNLETAGVPSLEDFYREYKIISDECWEAYRKEKLSKEALRNIRFNKTLQKFGIHDEEIAMKMGFAYVERGPHKTNLIEGAIEVLDFLKPKYPLHIITNGFEEVQHIKLEKSGLAPYFDQIITSEQAGVKKPHPKIFEIALEKTGAKAGECLMIGDNYEADILGGLNAGFVPIYYNPTKKEVKEYGIKSIQQLNDLITCFE